MMSSKENDAIPKLVDFGLSKIIGPNEKASEPFGTVGYVAPEVLQRQPYSFSCDVWSIGCIVYALIAGSLPFDSNEERETKRMTIQEELVFVEDVWKSTSKQCKDLLTRFLIKDQHARITLDEALKHPFFDSVRDDYILPASK
jgi:serine/threonine protein kinase